VSLGVYVALAVLVATGVAVALGSWRVFIVSFLPVVAGLIAGKPEDNLPYWLVALTLLTPLALLLGFVAVLFGPRDLAGHRFASAAGLTVAAFAITMIFWSTAF
jgi:hypothetical protein